MRKILILANHVLHLKLFRRELIQRLVDEGADVILSFPVDTQEDYIFEGCTIIDTPLNRMGTNPIQDLKLFFKYISILQKNKPDVVLAYTIKPDLYGGLACRILKVPYILTITGLGVGPEMGGLVSVIIKTLSRAVYKKARVVFMQNKGILEYLESINALSGNGILVTGSGVNLERHSPLPYPAADAPITFSFASRILKEKGIDEYLTAARYLKGKYPETVFNVMGAIDHPEYREVLEKAQKDGVINYLGFQKEMRPWIERCHCTVLPSYYPEGLPNILLESAASCRPLITADMPGCNDALDDGITGFLCKPKDAADLTNKMEQFILMPYEKKVKMGLDGHEKVSRECDRNNVIKKYCEQIDIICENKKSN